MSQEVEILISGVHTLILEKVHKFLGECVIEPGLLDETREVWPPEQVRPNLRLDWGE